MCGYDDGVPSFCPTIFLPAVQIAEPKMKSNQESPFGVESVDIESCIRREPREVSEDKVKIIGPRIYITDSGAVRSPIVSLCMSPLVP